MDDHQQRRREYLRNYQRKWIANRRAQFMSGKCCEKCGSTDQLELDHIDPSTKIDHNIWSWREDRRAAEIEKCQILCFPCHRLKTIEERGQGDAPHGTLHRYRNYRCRCDECRAAKAEDSRKYRAKVREAKVENLMKEAQ